MLTRFEIPTHGPGLYEFTAPLSQWLAGLPVSEGVLVLMIQHTSASLLIQENADPDVQADLTAFFHRLVPPTTDPAMSYLTHTHEGPDDMPAHIKAAMMPVSLSIPVTRGRMALGTWQGLYVVEHRSRPQRRHVVARLLAA